VEELAGWGIMLMVLTNVDEAIDPALGNSETGATPLGV
jgi:hypothetical protein